MTRALGGSLPPSCALPLSYVLPLKWSDDDGLAELAGYLNRLADCVEVIVVDGSPEPLFAEHRRAFAGQVRHVPPDPRHRCLNGKVAGVHTGVQLACRDRVVVADDDVRYTTQQLAVLAEMLDRADVVRPLNVFCPMPWHARWDSARTLLNCALGSDYPGTLGLRRASFVAAGGYDGDVLFENLELLRTMAAAGYVEVSGRRPVVCRLPPTPQRFWQQRIRQAYDSQAQPARLAVELALLPAMVLLGRRAWLVPAGAVGLAALGRLRAGVRLFPADVPLWATCWVLERAVCSWLALGLRCAGGVDYAGRRIRVAAHSTRRLRRRVAVTRR